MNNAQISRYFDEEANEEQAKVAARQVEALQGHEASLTKLMENLRWVGQSEQWRSLKDEYFVPRAETLEKELLEEATKDSPDVLKLAKINGQLMWARRYSDLSQLADTMRVELTGIRKLLYGTNQNRRAE